MSNKKTENKIKDELVVDEKIDESVKVSEGAGENSPAPDVPEDDPKDDPEEMKVETREVLTSKEQLKHFAQINGLMALTLNELKQFADYYDVPKKGSKETIARAIMNKGNNFEYFVLGKPIGNMQVKTAVHGYKAGIIYPVDKEREKFFLNTQVFKSK